MKKKSIKIVLYNLHNNTVFGEYSSIIEASKSINCNENPIRRAGLRRQTKNKFY